MSVVIRCNLLSRAMIYGLQLYREGVCVPRRVIAGRGDSDRQKARTLQTAYSSLLSMYEYIVNICTRAYMRLCNDVYDIFMIIMDNSTPP